MTVTYRSIVLALALSCTLPAATAAQSSAPPRPAAPAAQPAAAPESAGPSGTGTAPSERPQDEPDPDLQLVPAEPDFTLAVLPTGLRLPAGKFAFRMTHRFTRAIASGTVGDFFADFFGFDSAGRIGLEFRYGLQPGTQIVFHRTNDRAIQFLGQQQVLAQTDRRHLSFDVVAAVEGADNFSEDFGGTLGAVIAHRFADRGAVYAQPYVVLNADPAPEELTDDNHTFMVGLGARLRLGQSRTYLVAEVVPRLGYDAGVDHVSFGVEKRAGGHLFHLTVSNALGTTLRQIARGGARNEDWYIGFNLTRKFY